MLKSTRLTHFAAELTLMLALSVLSVFILAPLTAWAGMKESPAEPPCAAPMTQGMALHAVKLEDDGALRLDNGQALLPEGLVLPTRLSPAPDMQETARRVLADILEGRDIFLARTDTDRYGRLVGRAALHGAQDEKEDLTLVLLHAGAGLARPLAKSPAASSPDARKARGPCNRAWLAAETQARMGKLGIWTSGKVIVPANDENSLAAHVGLFTIVEGKVMATGVTRNRVYVNFDRRWSEDFTIMLARKDFATIFGDHLDPATLQGAYMRVRGVVQEEGGPAIFLKQAEDVTWWTQADEERVEK